MATKRKVLFALLAVGISLLFGACASGPQGTAIYQEGNMGSNTYGLESTHTEASQRHLDKVQPPPSLDTSLERENLVKRMQQLNDPNQVRYFYGLSYDGKILCFYTIKGTVSSVNSLLTDPTQIIQDPYGTGGLVVESPDLNGTYGPNGPDNSVFFFTTSGAMVDWEGPYMVATQPLQLAQPPVLTEAVNSKVQGASR